MSALDRLSEPLRAFETALAAGVYAYTTGQYDDADVAFRDAARLAPTRPEPANGLGMVAAALGDANAARCAYQRAVGGFYHLRSSLLLSGQLADAAHDKVNALLVVYLIGVLFDARGLGHIAGALHQQGHDARV